MAAGATSTGLRERAESGRAVFGTVDSWLLFNLTGEHVTDPSNASRTLLFDIGARGAGTTTCAACSACPSARCPRCARRAAVRATLRGGVLPGHDGVPVAGVAGDQQAALFGQACLDTGLGKNTYGTGSFVLLNTGATPPPPAAGLLATVAWGIGRASSPTRSRRRSSSPGPRCSGCATAWG